jgi:hypothetical protein
MNKDPLYLYRFIDHEVRESYIQIADHNSLRLPSVLHKSYMQGIIISDYNKGTVNKSAPHFIPIAPWIIVDSRYRSVHPDYLNLAQYRIWRCTGDEFDEEWAKQFNLVVHTNGSDRIRLIDSPSPVENRTCIFEFTVPVIDPIDTCGAGDTFTAMLGAQLLLGKEVKDSIPLCIKAAQEVCMKKYTAITTEKL